MLIYAKKILVLSANIEMYLCFLANNSIILLFFAKTNENLCIVARDTSMCNAC